VIHLERRYVTGLPARIAALSLAALGATAMAAAPAHASSGVSTQASIYCQNGGGYRGCLSLWNSERDPRWYNATICNRNKNSYLRSTTITMRHAVKGGWRVAKTVTLKPGKCTNVTHGYVRHQKVCMSFYMSGSDFALIALCHKW
jgi:hypothetical protein